MTPEPSTPEFGDQHVFITGGASGIGLATARGLAQRGARLTLVDRQTPRERIAVDSEPHVVTADVTDAAAVAAGIQSGMARHGPVTGAVLCAGVLGPVGPLHDNDPAELRELFDINVMGVVNALQPVLAGMVAAGGGSVVAISSAAGTVGFPTAAAYTAAKHAVVGLVRTCALDYAEHGIRVNAVAPGGVDTPLIRATTCATPEGEAMITGLHPMKRLADPAEIAEAVIYLLSERASFVTGAVLAVDGGWTAQ